VQQVEQRQEERNNNDVFVVMLRKERGKEGMGY
jgi:hypothetical protein